MDQDALREAIKRRVIRSTPVVPHRDATSYDPGQEVDAAEVGLTPALVKQVWQEVEALYASGIHPAIQLCVRRQGRIVLNRAIGHASGNGPGDGVDAVKVLVRPDTPFCLFSASKAVTLMLIHVLAERGQIEYDESVSRYLPEFARHDKAWITIRDLLQHRAGVPSMGLGLSAAVLLDWEGMLERLYELRPAVHQDRRLAYHAASSGYLLSEIIRRVDGRGVRQFMREEVTEPLGLTCFDFGIEAAQQPDVVQNYFTGVHLGPPMDWAFRRALGITLAEGAPLSNGPEWLSSVMPSGNIVSTAEQIGRFFELLLRGGELDGARIFSPESVRLAGQRTTGWEVDQTIGLPIRYGHGMMLGSRWISPFGPRCEQAFGHLGLSNVHVWADPERDLSVALLTSGKAVLGHHIPALWGVLRSISAFPSL